MEIAQIYAFALLFIPEKKNLYHKAKSCDSNLSMREVITCNFRYASLNDGDTFRQMRR